MRILYRIAIVVAACALAAPQALGAAVERAQEETALDQLAALFSEEAVGTSGRSAATCGAEGHCNYTTCPEPNCEDGQPTCTCVARTESCTDDHSVWPGGEDKHTVYNCTCSCGQGGNCIVRNPLTGDCIVPKQPGKVVA